MVDRIIRKYNREGEMIGIYFSGTGNTKYCVGKFLEYYYNDPKIEMYSIEEDRTIEKLKKVLILFWDIRFIIAIYL